MSLLAWFLARVSGMFSGRFPAGFLAWFQQGLFKQVLQQGFLGHGFDYAQK